LLATCVLFCHAVVTFSFFQTGKWSPPQSPFYIYLGTAPVTLFFFMSSFLFWTKCMKNNGVGSYGSFLMARARRLVPAYYASVGLVFLIVLVHMHFRLAESPLTIAGELARWLLFGLPAIAPAINGFSEAPFINAEVVWTLQFEVIFYLLLPVLFWLFKGYRVLLYLALMGAAYWNLARHGVTLLSDPKVTGAGPLVAMFLITFFGFGFGLGMLVALLYPHVPSRWKREMQQRRWSFIPLLCLVVPFILKAAPYTLKEFLPLLAAFLFIVSGNDLFGLLSTRAVFHLGRISYSFYITHGIVLFVASHLLNRVILIQTLQPLSYWIFVGITGTVAVCFATFVHLTIELRFLKPSSGLAQPPVAAPVFAPSGG
jgi:peptidoglycan/LPS O-acetylase OafA/YrhL